MRANTALEAQPHLCPRPVFRYPKRERKLPQKTQNPALKAPDSQTLPTAVEAQNIALKSTDSPKKLTAVEAQTTALKATDSQINPPQSKLKILR